MSGWEREATRAPVLLPAATVDPACLPLKATTIVDTLLLLLSACRPLLGLGEPAEPPTTLPLGPLPLRAALDANLPAAAAPPALLLPAAGRG